MRRAALLAIVVSGLLVAFAGVALGAVIRNVNSYRKEYLNEC
jgi:hypothetical protein